MMGWGLDVPHGPAASTSLCVCVCVCVCAGAWGSVTEEGEGCMDAGGGER